MHARMDRTMILLAALAVAGALGLAGCGDDSILAPGATGDGPTTSTGAPASTGGSATSSTTAAPATTPTTAGPGETSTSTTTPPAATTTTTRPRDPLLFRHDGLGIVDFGASPPDAISAVRRHLGYGKTFDSAWGPAWGDYGVCPGTEYRQVGFGGLTLHFTDADRFAPAGTRHFFAWSYDGDPAGITPPGGLDVGMTRADLAALYPAATFAYDDLWFGHVFRVEYPRFGEQLWGRLTGDSPSDTITYLTGGVACGE